MKSMDPTKNSESVRTILVVPFSGNSEAIFIGLRELKVDKIILVSNASNSTNTTQVQEDLEKFKVNYQKIILREQNIDEILKVFSDLKNDYPNDCLAVNLGSADKTLSSLCLSASFVFGIPCFDVTDGKLESLPVLKFEYSKILSDKKIALIKKMGEKEEFLSLEELSKYSNMSLPLVSYYIRGIKKNEGLVDLGLVEAVEKSGKLQVKLSPLGRLMLNSAI